MSLIGKRRVAVLARLFEYQLFNPRHCNSHRKPRNHCSAEWIEKWLDLAQDDDAGERGKTEVKNETKAVSEIFS